jgi:hypothetical protein
MVTVADAHQAQGQGQFNSFIEVFVNIMKPMTGKH